jgi:hypothetical protein
MGRVELEYKTALEWRQRHLLDAIGELRKAFGGA